MNDSFSFVDEDNSMYYGEEEEAKNNWNFTSVVKPDTRKVTSLRSKVDLVREEKNITMVSECVDTKS